MKIWIVEFIYPDGNAFVDVYLSQEEALFDANGFESRFSGKTRIYSKEITICEHKLIKAIKLLRDLADLQNGPPLVQHEKEWRETMDEVYEFLKENEKFLI
jgi:hypothetical protein